MTFNTALAEQVLANFPNTDLPCLEYEWGCPKYGDDRSRWCTNCQARAKRVSRPRCVCHNLYLEKCPNANPREAELKTEISNQLASLDRIPVKPKDTRCKKHGHKSRGKAEAQLRSILKNQDFRPDKKDLSNIEVYKCRRVECRPHPWHVGPNPYVRKES